MSSKTIYTLLVVAIAAAILLQIEWLYLSLFILLIALVAVQAGNARKQPAHAAMHHPTAHAASPAAMQQMQAPYPYAMQQPAARKRERPIIFINRSSPGAEYIEGLVHLMMEKTISELNPAEKQEKQEEKARMNELIKEVKELKKQIKDEKKKEKEGGIYSD